MVLSIGNYIIVSIGILIVILCSVGIIIASIFQMKQKKKYNECLNIIKEKDGVTLQFKNGLSKEEINNIDSSIDVDLLMKTLYDTFLKLEDRLNTLNNNFSGIATGYLKEFYKSKIETQKLKNILDITDRIDLINYSITEFNKKQLKFRITINCLNYKKLNDILVSGSDINKKEQVIILTFNKIKGKWLISNYEKVYESNLSV